MRMLGLFAILGLLGGCVQYNLVTLERRDLAQRPNFSCGIF